MQVGLPSAPAEVRVHRIRRDDQVETGDQRRGVEERILAGIRGIEHLFDPRRERHRRDLLRARVLLQRDQPDSRHLGERRKGGERDRAALVVHEGRAALP